MIFLECSNKPCVWMGVSGGNLGHQGSPQPPCVSNVQWPSQWRVANSPRTISSSPLAYTNSVLITDKAIWRLQIQRSPGHKTTAAGEPPSTSANAFAACAGEASNPAARYLQKANSLNPASSPASPGLPPPPQNLISLMQFNVI